VPAAVSTIEPPAIEPAVIDAAFQQGLDSSHLPVPANQSRLSNCDTTIPSRHAQPTTG
jgi:hypothetical protein